MAPDTIPNYSAIIAYQVKKLRASAGMTQVEVAERCGIFRTYLSRVELGKANPTISVSAILAQVLKVDLKELLIEDLTD